MNDPLKELLIKLDHILAQGGLFDWTEVRLTRDALVRITTAIREKLEATP